MKTLFSAIILALLLLNAPVVDACSCVGYPAVCGSYKNAHAVFIGVVQSVDTNKLRDRNGREYSGEITRDLEDIKLTFPFPYCKKAKEER